MFYQGSKLYFGLNVQQEIWILKVIFWKYAWMALIYVGAQGDCREEARRAYKIPISAWNRPFGQPGW